MNAIMLILVATGGLKIAPPPEKPTYHVVLKNGTEFYGYEKERKQDGRLGEIVTYVLDEPFREGTEVVRESQEPVATRETHATRERRWERQFEENPIRYEERPTPDGPEFFPKTELALMDRALANAQAVADAAAAPPPLPEEPEFEGNPDASAAGADPPGFIRLWGPEVFLFVFSAVIIAFLVKTFLMKEAENGD